MSELDLCRDTMPDGSPRPNIPLLKKVLDHIDAHPEEWLQRSWARQTPCGTAFCIAGHAAVMVGAEPIFTKGISWTMEALLPDGTVGEIPTIAAQALGLTESESSWEGSLFASANTRADVQRYAEAIAARAGERL